MDERIIKIAKEYGYMSQSNKIIEEMAELTQALCKASASLQTMRSMTSARKLINVMDEMADVQIMLLQMQFLLGMSDEDLKERMNKKIERQLRRIETGEE